MDAANTLSDSFLEAYPADAARTLEYFAADEIAAALTGLTPALAAEVIRRMVPPMAADCLAALPAELAAATAGAMPLEMSAPILRRLSDAVREDLLKNMPAEDARDLRTVLHYPDETAGALMDPRPFTLPEDITVHEALERVREAGRGVKHYLYVVDRDRRLAGVLNLRDFLLAEPGVPLASLIVRNVARLTATSTLPEILDNPTWELYLSMPVVDRHDVFLGVLEQKTLRAAEATLDARAGQRLTATWLAIGELYWDGMFDVVVGLLGGAARPTSPASGDSNVR